MEKSINKNITNTAIIVLINYIFISLISFAILQFFYSIYKSIIIACTISLFFNTYVIIFSNNVLLKLNYVSRLPFEHEKRIKSLLQSISNKLEMPIPSIYYINDKNINSISICTNINKAHICLTKGCFSNLNDNELEYLLTYEMIRILKRDTCFSTVSAVTVGRLIILSDKFFRSIFRSIKKRGKESESFMRLLITSFFLFFSPINVWIINLFIHNNLELENDANVINITNKPLSAIDTLQKCLETNKQNIIYSRTCANMFFVNPLIYQKTSKKFSYHISIENRINAIKNN